MKPMAALLLCLAIFFTALPAGAQAAQEPVWDVQTDPFPLYRHTLPNGLSLWVQPRHDSDSVVALLVVGAGARYEDESNNGISHFVEHMVFTGTEQWSEEHLKQVIARRGGRYNGWTGKERTSYLAQVSAGDLDVALLWLSEVVFHPTFPPDKVDKEREVIFQERYGRYGWLINALDTLGFGYELERDVQRALFPDSSLGVRTVGEDGSLERIDRQALLDYYQKHYTPGNATLILVGKVDPDHALKRAEANFGDLAPGGCPPAPATPPLPPGGPQQVTVRGPMLTDQVELTLGARTVGRLDPDRWPLEVLAVLMDGALTQEIRYRRGLVYGLSAGNTFFDDTGYLAVSTTAEAGNQGLIRDEAEAYLARVAAGEVDEGVVAVATNAMRGRWALNMEDNLARARWLADWTTVVEPGQAVPNYATALTAVTAEDLARVAGTYFVPERQYLGLHVPVVTFASGAKAAVILIALLAAAWVLKRIARRKRSLPPIAEGIAPAGIVHGA